MDSSNFDMSVSYASRVFSKTASSIASTNDNPFIGGKITSSIDRDKVSSIDYMYKHSSASILSVMGPSALKALAAAGTIAGVSALALPSIAKRTGKAFVQGSAEETKEKANQFKTYALGVGIPATLVTALGAAKAGLFGEKAETYADNVTDKVLRMFGSGGKSNYDPPEEDSYNYKVDRSFGSPGYKYAAAKTYCNLRKAESLAVTNSDREKLAEAAEECAKVLFDAVFYF